MGVAIFTSILNMSITKGFPVQFNNGCRINVLSVVMMIHVVLIARWQLPLFQWTRKLTSRIQGTCVYVKPSQTSLFLWKYLHIMDQFFPPNIPTAEIPPTSDTPTAMAMAVVYFFYLYYETISKSLVKLFYR
ncbi:hypothetical protein ACB092_02G032000 [Castanea dentata]